MRSILRRKYEKPVLMCDGMKCDQQDSMDLPRKRCLKLFLNQEKVIHSLNGKNAMRHSNKGRGRILGIDDHQQMSMLLVNTIAAYKVMRYSQSAVLNARSWNL
jgi:hypothetical protein